MFPESICRKYFSKPNFYISENMKTYSGTYNLR